MKPPAHVSLREIADTVGVSVSTVSRALGDSNRVSPLTKQAVRAAMSQLADGRHATTDNTATRPMIGVTHSHFTRGASGRGLDIILEQVLAGVEIACLRAGYIPYPWQQSPLLTGAEGDPFFAAVSGVVMGGGLIERALLTAIHARGIPVIIIGGHVPELSVPSVAADNTHGMAEATRHLVRLGHRRIGLVNGPTETYTSFEKRAGYLAALTEAGLPADPALIRAGEGYHGFDAPAAEACTEALLALPQPPTAILYASDTMVESGIRVLQRHGLSIPRDISVIGFHDDHNARYLHPPLTSVHVDRTVWGEVATEQLLQLIGGAIMRPTRTLLPVELIIRASTGPAPVQENTV